MRRNGRLAIAGLTATAVAAAAAAVMLTAPIASADVPGWFVDITNNSDPHIIRCTAPATSTTPATPGYCLYTSRDMGQQYAYLGNPYPMYQTNVFFSPTGYNQWQPKGVALNESTITVGQTNGFVPRRTDCTSNNPPTDNKPKSPDVSGNCKGYHVWAPSAVYYNGSYYLYVPDVSSTTDTGSSNVHNSSRISVHSSASPFGPFGYLGTVPFTSGYMSDPDVIVDGSNRYLIWADGDGETCGGFKSAKLATDMRSLETAATVLTIGGIEALGSCDPKGSAGPIGRPYMEGASIYKKNFNPTRPWTLLFAVKPTLTPPGCDSQNEAIAWASAANPQGPYTYEGIVICGSSTEWTNQATITVTSTGKLIIIYHDAGPSGSATFRQRKLHADCLFVGYGVIGRVHRQPVDATYGFNHCTGQTNQDNFRALLVRDLQQTGKPPLFSWNNGDPMVNRYEVGTWERFRFQEVVGQANTYTIISLANSRYLCPDISGTLNATCTSASGSALFTWTAIGPVDVYWLKSVSLNRYVNMDSSGRLVADLTTTTGAATFTKLGYTSQPLTPPVP